MFPDFWSRVYVRRFFLNDGIGTLLVAYCLKKYGFACGGYFIYEHIFRIPGPESTQRVVKNLFISHYFSPLNFKYFPTITGMLNLHWNDITMRGNSLNFDHLFSFETELGCGPVVPGILDKRIARHLLSLKWRTKEFVIFDYLPFGSTFFSYFFFIDC